MLILSGFDDYNEGISKLEYESLLATVEHLRQEESRLKDIIQQNERTVKAADGVLYNQLKLTVGWNKRLDELLAENKRLEERVGCLELEAENIKARYEPDV